MSLSPCVGIQRNTGQHEIENTHFGKNEKIWETFSTSNFYDRKIRFKGTSQRLLDATTHAPVAVLPYCGAGTLCVAWERSGAFVPVRGDEAIYLHLHAYMT